MVAAVFRESPPRSRPLSNWDSPCLSRLASLPRDWSGYRSHGSGKSTTLAAIIDEANRTRKDHIITIEDPIEFVHQSRVCW